MEEYITQAGTTPVSAKERIECPNELTQQARRIAWIANAVMDDLQRLGIQRRETHQHLLHEVISSSVTGDDPTTSLHEAAKNGRGMAAALASDHLNKDILDLIGRAPLHWAAQEGHIDALQQLIDAGADIHIRDGFMRTPLHLTACCNQAECMLRLLLAGCRVDQRDIQGFTALHLAALTGSLDSVRLLLSKGASLAGTTAGDMAASQDLRHRLPLHLLSQAVIHNVHGMTHEIVQEIASLLLAAHPGSINVQDLVGLTPVAHVLEHNNVPLLQGLVRAGASLVFRTVLGHNLLNVAVQHGTVATLHFLLQVQVEGGLQENHLDNIQHRARDSRNLTPWQHFIRSIYCSPKTQYGRRPDAQTRVKFVDLYRSVRDTDIHHDISVLQNTLASLTKDDASSARNYLHALASRKIERHDESAAAWYHGLAGQTIASDGEAALAGIEDSLKDLNDELHSSPWDFDTEWWDYANASQWHEISEHSFWIEPAEAFVSKKKNAPVDSAEREYMQQNDSARFERGPDTLDRYIHCSQITQIFSISTELLFEAAVDTCTALEFLEKYK